MTLGYHANNAANSESWERLPLEVLLCSIELYYKCQFFFRSRPVTVSFGVGFYLCKNLIVPLKKRGVIILDNKKIQKVS